MLKFNAEVMEQLCQEDDLINRMFKDLSRRNPHIPKDYILETVFNSEVLEDAFMQESYLECEDLVLNC